MAINLADTFGNGGPKLWVSGKSYAKGDQVISDVDLCTYIRKVAGAGSTDPASDTTNWQPFGGRPIKAIQRGSFSGFSGSTTITIAAVNPKKTELRLLSSTTESSSSAAVKYCKIELNSTGTAIILSMSYGPSYYDFPPGSWELTEYY
ncbi:hypothetical protein [Azorhizophilus paspali]|uniref:Uncharacterized protein n=1 Tax=Azorhizophilus paspali TaxID=69963 RepID=A0ABV6SFY6_AZOPA